MNTSVIDPGTPEIHVVQAPIRNISVEALRQYFYDEEDPELDLHIYDMPGLETGVLKDDDENFEKYIELLPDTDVVFWVLRAENAAFGPDVRNIADLVKVQPSLKDKIVIGINRCDLVPPHDWDTDYNLPSKNQMDYINRYVMKCRELIFKQCGLKNDIVTYYSARKAWNIDQLFDSLISAVPKNRRWLFGEVKPDYFPEFLQHVPEENRARVTKYYNEIVRG